MIIICDGFKSEIDDSDIDNLLEIPITPWNADFWDKYHSRSMSVDISIPYLEELTINWDQNKRFDEIHQIDPDGVHNFSIHRDRWIKFIN